MTAPDISRRRARPKTVVRPEIQALRAIAVLAVVLYHLWPNALPGGYVGVDVFFVISGFLIVGHLVRDAATGRISLLRFWARRARRLLPASLTVLIATGIATVVWVPDVVWRQWFEEIGASAIYLQNWLLASNSVDYLGADNAASPVQHYWSLSVEEQFYIAFPLVIVAVLALSRRATDASRRRNLAIALAVVTAASLAFSIHQVATDPAPAYFSTLTRAWEFGLGGLLAFLAPVARRSGVWVSWAGLGLIAAALLLFDERTVFPGAAALLPVVGTLAVIWAGMPVSRLSPAPIFALPPVRWIGDISYSFYLWHWPPILILPFAVGHQLTDLERVGILLGAILAAALTKRVVEDTLRAPSRLSAASAVRSIVATLAVTAFVVGGSALAHERTEVRIVEAGEAINAAIDAGTPCLGAAAMTDDCADPFALTEFTDPAFAKSDIGVGVESKDECKQTIDRAKLLTCEFGDTESPKATVALVGDSHAGHLLAGLEDYAAENDIKVVTMLKTWCNASGIEGITSPHSTEKSIESCAEWGDRALDAVVEDESIDAVLFSTYSTRYSQDFEGREGDLLTPEDYESSLKLVEDEGTPVVVVRSTPEPGKNVPDCISRHLDDETPCSQKRADVVIPEKDDPVVEAARSLDAPVIDLTDSFCDAKRCHWVIGGLIPYFDNSHLAESFSRTLAPEIGEQLEDALQLEGAR